MVYVLRVTFVSTESSSGMHEAGPAPWPRFMSRISGGTSFRSHVRKCSHRVHYANVRSSKCYCLRPPWWFPSHMHVRSFGPVPDHLQCTGPAFPRSPGPPTSSNARFASFRPRSVSFQTRLGFDMTAAERTLAGLGRWIERCNAPNKLLQDLIPFEVTGQDKPLGYMLPSCVEIGGIKLCFDIVYGSNRIIEQRHNNNNNQLSFFTALPRNSFAMGTCSTHHPKIMAHLA